MSDTNVNSIDKYPGAALIHSRRYMDRADIAAVALDANKEYTFEEADKLVNAFSNKTSKKTSKKKGVN